MLRIALAQINTTVGDLKGNQQKVELALARAQETKVDIIAFPELTLTGYPPEDLLHKAHFVGNNIKALGAIAEKTAGITAIVGFVDSDKDKNIYNAAAVISDGKIRGIYYKHELPNYSVFDERRYFTPGFGNGLFKLSDNLFAVNICEDIWVDHSRYAQQAKAGAQLLINISSSPYYEGKIKVREELLKRRALETNTFIAYVNSIGGQDELVFDGASFVISPQGKVIAAGKQFEEDLIITDLPIKDAAKNNQKMIPVAEVISAHINQSREPVKSTIAKKLDPTQEVYRALVLGTHDYVKKNGFQKVAIGLSGGIDSALVAVIACDALGSENVIGITMPSQFTSSGTYSDSKKLAINLGIHLIDVPIERIHDMYLKSLDQWFGKLEPNEAEENLQARIRGNIMMAFSNKFGWLVLTTGNKSEMAVGYCTLYGDMSGGFAVIKDILKTKVYELSRFRNSLDSKPLIPKSVFLRAPSAELRPNQTDQDTLPDYELLDRMLIDYVEKHKSLNEMATTKHELKIAKEVIRMVDRSEYKRRQAPPGVKISPRAFGKDWRLPITNKYKEF